MSSWTLYDEGGANLVYRNPRVPDKLLRVPKDVTRDPRWQLEQHQCLAAMLHPYCVRMELVKLADSDVESVRNDFGLGLMVDFVGHIPGYEIIQDMAPQRLPDATIHDRIHVPAGGPDASSQVLSTTVEFKPKWLIQSPNAPQSARRCRTCALKCYRAGVEPTFCRLDLASDIPETVKRAVTGLVHSYAPPSDWPISRDDVIEASTQYLCHNPVIARLKAVQALDSKGILGYKDEEALNDEFLLAMTARDCSLFIEIVRYLPPQKATGYLGSELPSGQVFVRGRLVDLDIKSPAKRTYWKNLELSLAEHWS